MDRFPKAFRRFESQVDTRDVTTIHQLEMMFGQWAGSRWIPTSRQLEALNVEAEKRGIPTRYVHRRRFSSQYESFSLWMTQTRTTSRYQQRIASYMSRYPHATLKEARGHKKR